MASHESIARAIEILNEQEADEGPLPPGLDAARKMLRDRLQELAGPAREMAMVGVTRRIAEGQDPFLAKG